MYVYGIDIGNRLDGSLGDSENNQSVDKEIGLYIFWNGGRLKDQFVS